ncbi:hypothetical protein MEBOL_003865 [Melittangium boletus DSM 14713]|uniref:Uncharacterized protein n=1 Tax=Melittangium boletus DSM 14713 TaxID=1294270 RepID=A0A250IEY4_9BACT|nr:hypothetical protein MEBOL_003865 [Melittangium boletus DSM 14713]
MIPAMSSFDERVERRSSWFFARLVSSLLMLSACRESSPSPPDEPAAKAVVKPRPVVPTAGPSSPPIREGSQADAGIDRAQWLKAEADHVFKVELLSCPSGHVLATMPPAMLSRLQRALSHTVISRDSVLTTPPWMALLAFHFEDGQTLFGQLVRTDFLRLYGSAQCTGARADAQDMRLGEDASFLSDWIQGYLGPSQEKEYQAPAGLPPLPKP